ncbi:MAG TPA: ATP-dependent DNA helicase RecQ, partial [Allosphingosinicella sp.]|nr:ATP-dependent DNA helicase RecQ [Allosphingosinicella sp.]
MTEPLSILRSTFGFSEFRGHQAEVVARVMAGKHTLAVMPTGAGKSLCYQVPALARAGTALVISPLIALMHDQIRAADGFGIKAAALTSADEDREETVARLRRGDLDILYVAPERASGEGFKNLLSQIPLSLIAIDEAHCVSEWGHDFRPDYRLLRPLLDRFPGVPRLALTATADRQTRADILVQLGIPEDGLVLAGFDRPNIRYHVHARDGIGAQLKALMSEHPGPGIVYATSRAATEKLAEQLGRSGRKVLAYHAGLDARVRAANQRAFVTSEDMVMVATIAFGMGIDKPDVRFVAHAGLPKSIEAYYQEIGRAGRDGLPADTLTLYGLEDMRLRRLQVEESAASEEQKRVERQRLNALVSLCEAPRCRRQTLLAYFAEAVEPCGNCDLCNGNASTFDGTVEAQKILSAIARTGEIFGAEHLVNVLVGEATEAVRRHRHDALKTFGIGKDRSKGEWRSLIRQLYAAGLVSVELDGYGSFTLTERGVGVLKGKERIELRA